MEMLSRLKKLDSKLSEKMERNSMGCDNNFGALLKQARNNAGYSQAGLGFKFRPDASPDAAKNTICRFETDGFMPTQKECRHLAKILGVPPRTLHIDNCPVERKRHVIRPAIYEDRICRGCNKPFKPNNGKQIYCTPKCRYDNWCAGDKIKRQNVGRHRKCRIRPVARLTFKDAANRGSFHDMSTEHFEKSLKDILTGKTDYVPGGR